MVNKLTNPIQESSSHMREVLQPKTGLKFPYAGSFATICGKFRNHMREVSLLDCECTLSNIMNNNSIIMNLYVKIFIIRLMNKVIYMSKYFI